MANENAINAVIDGFYAAANGETPWEAALLRTSDLFDGSGVLIGSAPAPDRFGLTNMARLDPNLVRVFDEQYSTPETNPVAARVSRMKAGTTYELRSLMPVDVFRRDPMYADLWRTQGLLDTMGAMFPNMTPICVLRPEVKGMWEDVHRRVFEGIKPHINRAVCLAQRMAALAAANAAAASALDWTSTAVAVLGAGASPMHLNAGAVAIDAAGDGLRFSADGPVAARARDTRALRALVAEAVAPRPGGSMGGAMRLPRPSGAPDYLIEVHHLRLPTHLVGGGAPVAMMLISDDQPRDDQIAARLQRLYSLSPREAFVAQALINGDDVGAISERLRLSQNTVRTHIKHVLAKTGVRRQGEFIALALRGPAGMRRPPRGDGPETEI